MGESSKAEFWTSSSSNYNLFNQSSDLSGIKRNIPFLVACYATLHPALSVRRSVGPSVCWFVGSLVCWSVNLSIGPSCPIEKREKRAFMMLQLVLCMCVLEGLG